MPIEELKCIEILIRFLARNSNLKAEISSEFNEAETFNNSKVKLFNLISIYDLIENFDLNQPFSLEQFLIDGKIPGMYKEATHTPDEDPRYFYDYKQFYTLLIEALKEGNYLFDESNNLFISSTKLETTIPQVWLYRLAQATKRNKYQRMYFYNKNKENNITDKNALLDYLHHTKTFLVELSSSNPNIDYDVEFSSTEAKTNTQIKNNREIKISDIMEIFQEEVSPGIQSKISKYKLTDAFFIIAKAEHLGRTFYSETLDVQQKYLNKWMIEFINSNEKAKEEAQKLVLIANDKNTHSYDIDDLNRKSAIIGLINLYLRIINSLDLDLELTSFTDFSIEEYLNPQTEKELVELNKVIRSINKSLEQKSSISKDLESLTLAIAKLDIVKDKEELAKLKKEREALLEMFTSHEDTEEQLSTKRNNLQDSIRIAKQTSVESIAFDNKLIINLLLDCISKGRVYFKLGSKQIIFETYNEELGKVVFKSTINLEKLIVFIENFNYRIEDFGMSLR